MSVVDNWLLQYEREEELLDMHFSLLFIPSYFLEDCSEDSEVC